MVGRDVRNTKTNIFKITAKTKQNNKKHATAFDDSYQVNKRENKRVLFVESVFKAVMQIMTYGANRRSEMR
jgi:hypothetical protein